MDLNAAHWIYLAGVVVIIGVMIARKNVVVPAVVATFLTAWVYSGSLVRGLSSVFTAGLTAASELFNIFLIIALITALLGALRAMGAERRMVRPFQGLMRNGRMAFFALVAVTYFISLFFWPTPAVPLIGAILLPAAIRAGLPAISAAAVIAIAGQGMALSSDYVIQVAPGLSAKAAGVSTAAVADRALVLSLVTGIVALGLVYWRARRTISPPSAENLLRWEEVAEPAGVTAVVTEKAAGKPWVGVAASLSGTGGSEAAAANGAATGTTQVLAPPTAARSGDGPAAGPGDSNGAVPCELVRRSRVFAVLVPLCFAALVVYMLLGKFTSLVPETLGSDAAALVGGVAILLLFAASLSCDGAHGLTTSASHLVDGLVFAFKAMGVVIPIAGFFFIGNADFAGRILGLAPEAKPPALLFDLVTAGQQYIPNNPFILSFAILLIGMITGLEGSGFSGLPLTGSLSGALGPAGHIDPASLAALGQMGSVWAGGGVLIAWSSLLAVAGVARVNVQDLARYCFVPVIAGLVTATVVSVLVF
ncbi:hypothetical protein [Streptomyces sp. NPDC000880]